MTTIYKIIYVISSLTWRGNFEAIAIASEIPLEISQIFPKFILGSIFDLFFLILFIDYLFSPRDSNKISWNLISRVFDFGFFP